MQEAQEDVGFNTALDVWRRRKWLAILVFIETFTAVVSGTIFLSNTYQSTVTLFIERQQVPEAFVQSTVTRGIDF